MGKPLTVAERWASKFHDAEHERALGRMSDDLSIDAEADLARLNALIDGRAELALVPPVKRLSPEVIEELANAAADRNIAQWREREARCLCGRCGLRPRRTFGCNVCESEMEQ